MSLKTNESWFCVTQSVDVLDWLIKHLKSYKFFSFSWINFGFSGTPFSTFELIDSFASLNFYLVKVFCLICISVNQIYFHIDQNVSRIDMKQQQCIQIQNNNECIVKSIKKKKSKTDNQILYRTLTFYTNICIIINERLKCVCTLFHLFITLFDFSYCI